MSERGQFTAEIAKMMQDFLGRPSSATELQLIPYLQFVMVNDQKIDPKKINTEERDVLSLLRQAGHIEGGAGGISVTEEFWHFMCRVLLVAYVDFENRPGDAQEQTA